MGSGSVTHDGLCFRHCGPAHQCGPLLIGAGTGSHIVGQLEQRDGSAKRALLWWMKEGWKRLSCGAANVFLTENLKNLFIVCALGVCCQVLPEPCILMALKKKNPV